MLTLGDIAKIIGAECHGDSAIIVTSFADIQTATPGQLSFIINSNYLDFLTSSKASAIITSPEILAEGFPDKLIFDNNVAKGSSEIPGNFLLMDNPYLGYAKAAQLFDSSPKPLSGIHPSAVIAEDVEIAAGVSIGALVVIDDGCVLGENVTLGAGCHLGRNVNLGDGSLLFSGVNIYHNVQIGQRAVLHSGCVIGSDGFGFANDAGEWVKIPQLGQVIIGDDFEAGANTTIDRGALNNTLIGNGVKLDNLVHIAHNVEIGDATAIAATTGIAGGTTIGKACTLAGRVSVIGHLSICDNVHLTISTVLTRSITEPGVYSSGDVAQPNKEWKRKTARMRQLDDLFTKVRRLEKELKAFRSTDK